MAESTSFEAFKSELGLFLTFPLGSLALEADALVLSTATRSLSAFKGGRELAVTFPRLSAELVDMLARHDRVTAVALVIGGIADGIDVPLTVNHGGDDER